MVSQCLRTESGFCACLIATGHETGAAATTHSVGTLAKIVDWDQLDNGLLGISAIGEQRIRILEQQVAASQLITGRVEFLEPEPKTPVPEHHGQLNNCSEL